MALVSFWLTSFSMIISRSTHVETNGIISFFFCSWVIFYCVYIYIYIYIYTHTYIHTHTYGLLWWLRWWRVPLQCRRPGFDPWVGKIPWRRAWQSTLVFLPGESPWTEESGGLQSMRSQRVGHNWAIRDTAHIYIYAHHIFFIHSSIDGYLGYFHVSAVVNSAAMNIRMHVSFQIRFSSPLDICPGVKLLDHMVALFLVF